MPAKQHGCRRKDPSLALRMTNPRQPFIQFIENVNTLLSLGGYKYKQENFENKENVYGKNYWN